MAKNVCLPKRLLSVMDACGIDHRIEINRANGRLYFDTPFGERFVVFKKNGSADFRAVLNNAACVLNAVRGERDPACNTEVITATPQQITAFQARRQERGGQLGQLGQLTAGAVA